MSEPIGLFGGTFDPIHYGHLRTAFELLQSLQPGGGRFLSTRTPGQPGFAVDDREIRRSGVSYSVDTLIELRREYPQRSLCLLLGMDAFLGMPTWHRWREIFELAHVVVAHRPGWKAPITGPLGEEMVDRGTGSVRELHSRVAGRIHVHAVTQLEIASTDLRALILSGRDLRYLVPDAVRDLIVRTGCYALSSR